MSNEEIKPASKTVTKSCKEVTNQRVRPKPTGCQGWIPSLRKRRRQTSRVRDQPVDKAEINRPASSESRQDGKGSKRRLSMRSNSVRIIDDPLE